MSVPNRKTQESSQPGCVLLHGGFAFNGAAAPTGIFGNWILSIVHTGTGIWTITLKPDFRGLQLIARLVALSLAASADANIHMGPYDRVAGTLVVRVLTAGSLADVAAGTDNYCFLELVVASDAGLVADGGGLYDV